MENFTLKAHTKAFLFALMIASIYAFAYAVKGIVDFSPFKHDEIFRKLRKSVLNCREVESIKDLRGRLSFPKVCPTLLVLGVQQACKYGKLIPV